MIGRLIDAFFWMGRYVERAENTARVIDVNYHASLKFDNKHPFKGPGDDGAFAMVPWSPIEPDSIVQTFILDEQNPSSVAACLSNVHLNAQKARNKMDADSWEVLHRSYISGASPPSDLLENERINEYCDDIRRKMHEFTGSIQSHMFRGEGWRYLGAGRLIERADNTLRQLKVYRSAVDASDAGPESRTKNRLFLKSAGINRIPEDRGQECLEGPTSILNLLLDSGASPRSVKYSLDGLHRILLEIQELYYPDRDLPIRLLETIADNIAGGESDSVDLSFFESNLERLAELSNELVQEFKEGSSDPSKPGRSLQSQQ
jgi:uncharacterized alpha-E superfamily protein